MADETGLPRKTIKIDGNPVLITEPVHVPIVQGDVVTEIRLGTNGGLVLGLAALLYEGQEVLAPEVVVVARLRISPEALGFIEQWLAQRRAAAAEIKKATN